MTTAADRAILHILRQMRADGRKAYLLGLGTESWRLLTAAYGELHGLTQEQASDELWPMMQPTRVL